jgi:F-type H+-transporting ATPase subunit b
MLPRLVFGIALASVMFGAVAVSAEQPAEAGEAAGHGAGHESGINWFGFSGEETRPALGFMFINFAIVAVAVFIILKGPIGRRVKTRREALVKALDEANAMKAEAERALAEARGKMEMLEVEMARIREDLLSGGRSEAARINADAERRAARMHEDAKAAVQQEIARLSQEIREEMVHSVITAAERAVAEKINAADHLRLAAEYVDNLRGAEPRATGR